MNVEQWMQNLSERIQERKAEPAAKKSRTEKSRREFRYLQPSEVTGLKNILFAAKMIVEGAYSGKHRSPFKGRSPEFTDYREYAPGDEMRDIDWKAFARTDRHMIKLFERESDMSAHLMVDRSASMAYGGAKYRAMFGKDDVSKLDYAFHLAAALAYLIVKQGDKVGLTMFDARVRSHLPPGGTFPHLYTLLQAMEKQTAGDKTSLATALRQAFPLFRRRGLLIVISDFLDEPAEVFRALNLYRHRGFEVILFHVMHRYERRLPDVPSINFIDLETAESMSAAAGDIAESYEREMEAFIRELTAGARARGMDYQLVTTDQPYVEALKKYLLWRRDA